MADFTWNYRIVEAGPQYYELRTVYYNEDGIPWGSAKVELAGGYDDPQEMVEDLRVMAADAFSMAVIKDYEIRCELCPLIPEQPKPEDQHIVSATRNGLSAETA